MTVILYEPRLCTMHELQTIYSVEDFYNFIEIIEVQRAFKDEERRKQEAENRRKQ